MVSRPIIGLSNCKLSLKVSSHEFYNRLICKAEDMPRITDVPFNLKIVADEIHPSFEIKSFGYLILIESVSLTDELLKGIVSSITDIKVEEGKKLNPLKLNRRL